MSKNSQNKQNDLVGHAGNNGRTLKIALLGKI